MKYNELSGLPDDQLLARTKNLVQQERDHNILIIDHLREIRERGLYLARGYSSLFQYTVKALRYSEGAAYRRLQTLKLCTAEPEIEQQLRNGELNLTTAAQLQTAIDQEQKDQRRGQRPPAEAAAPAVAPAPEDTAPAPHAARRQTASRPEPCHRDLIRQAAGRSSREVARLIADRNPCASQPRERLRSLGGGRWELRAVIEDSCQAGLEQLRALLAHVDPALPYGALLARLVADGLGKYDPRRQQGRTAAAAGTRPANGRAAARKRAAARCPAATEPRVSPAAGSAAAPRRSTAATSAPDEPAAGRRVTSAPKHATQDAATPQPPCPPPPPPLTSTPEHAAPGRDSTSAPKWAAKGAQPERALVVPLTAAVPGDVAGARSGAPRTREPRGPCRAGSGGALGRRPSRSVPRPSGTAAQEAAQEAVQELKESAPGRAVVVRRAIPAELRRAVWRRDDGACTFVDPETGRRCGSRHLLQIDHIQPFAMGGANSADNCRLLCAAHNRHRAGTSFGSRRTGNGDGDS